METAEFEQLVRPIALVVDDGPLIPLGTADMISDEGYPVVEAPQLLFTDVQMPGDLDGFDLARIVAKRWSHISVVIASGSIVSGPGDLSGKAKFIGKPFTAELVHQTLIDHGFFRKNRGDSI